jgi:ectoine hydroxylase-related dioxygenase (phytanoyl-CoA dioxygenase family)
MTKQEFQERVIKVEPSGRHFTLLVAPNGNFLGIGDDRKPATLFSATDQVMWESVEDGFRHVVSGVLLSSTSLADGRCELSLDGKPLSEDGSTDGVAGSFSCEHGPEKLPSEYLDTLRSNGWVCLTSILSPEILVELERVACTDRFDGEKYNARRPALSQNAAVAKTVAEPVSLWLIRQYMQLEDIRLGHSPAFAVLTRDDGKRVVQGWHADYPYHWGVPAKGRVPTPSGETVLGVQRNVCVSDFTKVGGATAFKLGSHAEDSPPPQAWGIASDHYKPGYRAEHGLPYSGPDADIVEAPGGSIIIYDSRTWHRAGINRTEHKRAALLQAMLPMYIMPKNDTSASYKDFLSSDAYAEVNDRVRSEIQNLMVHHYIGPGAEYAIGPDSELSDHIRDNKAGVTGY